MYNACHHHLEFYWLRPWLPLVRGLEHRFSHWSTKIKLNINFCIQQLPYYNFSRNERHFNLRPVVVSAICNSSMLDIRPQSKAQNVQNWRFWPTHGHFYGSDFINYIIIKWYPPWLSPPNANPRVSLDPTKCKMS